MDRRTAILASVAFVAALRRARAQPAARKVFRIGFLGIADPSTWKSEVSALRQGLRELGYEEGRNIVIEFRWADSDYARLPKLAAELADAKVDVLVTHGTPGSRAAKAATTTIPIVIAAVSDPVKSGLVASLARPGGNMTGNSIIEIDLTSKRLDLVKEFAPEASRVGFLFVFGTQTEAGGRAAEGQITGSAATLGIRVIPFGVRQRADLGEAFAAMKRERIDALLVNLDAVLAANYAEVSRLAIQYRIPTFGGSRQFIADGGLFGYGANLDDAYRHAAVYIDRILKGAKPADLPIEQPTRLELLINLKTAKALGVAIPQSLLLRADEVIK
jgi:putative ABC transport system substrate-binding protein